MTIDVVHLRCFTAAFDELSFTKAAAALYLSTPTLSQRIKTLERHVGCTLFDRSTHVVRPTLEARRLYPAARQIVYGMERLPDIAHGPGRGTRVRIAVPDVLGRSLRLQLENFGDGGAGWSPEFSQMPSHSMEDALLERASDLAVSRLAATVPSVTDLPLADEPFAVIVDSTQLPPRQGGGDGESVHIRDFAGFTLVGGPKHWRLWEAADYRSLRESDITVDHTLTHTDVGGLMMNLRHHRRIAVVPADCDMLCAVDRGQFTVRRLEGVTGIMHLQFCADDTWAHAVAASLHEHLGGGSTDTTSPVPD